jgi:dipeptidyl aminopeptidase/acylaminoacyl peptidase
MSEIAPFGSWQSPISATLIAGDAIGLDQPHLANGKCYWIEKRPVEAGRQVIVKRETDGAENDILPPPFSARSRVHEYGGAAYTVADDVIYFVNDNDQGIYAVNPGKSPGLLFAEPGLRFADLLFDAKHNRIVCICEDHGGGGEAGNFLVAITLNDPPRVIPLHRGHDFYASPTISPSGNTIAWISWSHPNMPWDGSELWLAELGETGKLLDPRRSAGGDSESIFQPQWSPDGQLYFVSDTTGWWQIYRYQESGAKRLCDLEAEFGLPQWVFGMSTYGFVSADIIICCYCQQGQWVLAQLCTSTGELSRIDSPYLDIASIRADEEHAVFLAGTPTSTTELVTYRPDDRKFTALKRSLRVPIDKKSLSIAQAVSFPAAGGSKAHGFFYAPQNGNFVGPDKERPPLIVMSHGGPTAATGSSLNLRIQFWTSRGFAVLDVNYGGSTGYGRGYRERLNGEWGIVDVADCEAGARYLATNGKVDDDRLIIRGSSAGGYTTLCALTFTDTFQAGASLYGIGDLEALVRDTHKFESRYLDRLVGPFPDSKKIYQDRSPLFHADRLSCPVIFFQGDEDRVVPSNQAESMVQALRENGIAVAYLSFTGEQHGFRRAETIARVLEAELYFYGKVFGFEPADRIETVDIENLVA